MFLQTLTFNGRSRVSIRVALLGAFALCSVVFAAEPAAAPVANGSGHWEGPISIGSGSGIPVLVDLTVARDGVMAGGLTFVGQELSDIPLNKISVKEGAIHFEVTPDRTFEGKLSPDGQVMEGRFAQPGPGATFKLKRTGESKLPPRPVNAAVSESIRGTWEGTFDFLGSKTKASVGLSNLADGTSLATFEFGNLSGVKAPIASFVLRGSAVTFQVPSFGLKFAGSLSGDGRDIVGSLTRTGQDFPLTLTHTGLVVN